MRDKVTVLLAAYNGENYIREQVRSIFSSIGNFELSLVISVDPSADHTDSILYEMQNESLMVLRNKFSSGGAKQNFAKLVDSALGLGGEYYAFSDQDDVWDHEKIHLTLSLLKKMELEHGVNTPLLVFSDSKLVDESLRLLAPSFMRAEALDPTTRNDFNRLLLHNVGQGCTFIFNRALMSAAAPIPDSARMHDHWFMLVACALGKIGYVPLSLVSYRQHGSNVLGGGRFGITYAVNRALQKSKEIRAAILSSQSQAKEFSIRFQSSISEDSFNFLTEYARLSNRGFFYRKWFCLQNRLRMSDALRTVGFYVFV